jgi:phage baseplate assembly protein gpV
VTVDTDTSPYTYMMQSNESDWDFIWRLARRHGLEFVLDGDSGKLRAVGADDGDAPWLQYGQSEKGHRLVSFRPRITNANLPETVSARYVDHMDKAIAVSVNMSDGKVYAGGSLVSIGGNGNFGELNGKGDFAMPNIVAKDEAQLRDAVESARDTLAATGFEAEGVAEGNPDLKPGKKVEIRGVGSYCGTFLLSEVTHMYRGSAGFQTKFVISSRPRLLLDAVNPPPTSASVASVSSPGNSLVRGEVTNLSDPDKVGRIRVKLPSIGQSDDPEGWWARIAGVSSGKERGLLMMPQVGDSVVVGFENGDTRSPFVLGSIWDGKALPGKDLVQDDGSFSLKSDSKILMKSTGDMVFETDGKVNQKASGDISIDGSSKIVIKGGQEIQIKAPQIKIQADSKIELKAPMISVAADAQLELKGSAMVSVSGGMIKLG